MDDEQSLTPTSDSTMKSLSELDLRTKKAYQFKSSVLERLREQRNSREFCDLVLRAENETFNVHKCVLVASSDYFEAMISRSGMQEATAGKQKLLFPIDSLNNFISIRYHRIKRHHSKWFTNGFGFYLHGRIDIEY